MLFHQRSTASLARLSPGLGIIILAVFNMVSNGHKKFKNHPKNMKPSRGVILCVIFASKNTKLG